jgi:hypothetical protein
MLFCDNDGEMINYKPVDLNSLGKKMNEVDVNVSQQVADNMSSII